MSEATSSFVTKFIVIRSKWEGSRGGGSGDGGGDGGDDDGGGEKIRFGKSMRKFRIVIDIRHVDGLFRLSSPYAIRCEILVVMASHGFFSSFVHGDIGYSDSESTQSCNVLSSAFAVDIFFFSPSFNPNTSFSKHSTKFSYASIRDAVEKFFLYFFQNLDKKLFTNCCLSGHASQYCEALR